MTRVNTPTSPQTYRWQTLFLLSDLDWHHSSEVRGIHPHYNWTVEQLRKAGFGFEKRSTHWRLLASPELLEKYLQKWYHDEVDMVPRKRWLS